MARKFKHKLTNFIAEETTSGKNYKVFNPRHFTIPKWIIEESSDWEEVIDWDTLLEEAKRRYPIGTKIKSFNTGNVRTIDCVAHNSKKDKYICSISPSYEWTNIPGEESNPFLYKDGKWAEIIEPNIVTEDGAKLYEGDIYWFVPTEKLAIWSNKEVFTIYGNNTLVCENKNSFVKGVKVFSSEEVAEAWIKKNKPVEKEYEILELRAKYSSPSYSPGDIIKHDINNISRNYFKMKSCFDIYAIKRLSDNQIFRLRNIVVLPNWEGCDTVLTKITIKNNKVIFEVTQNNYDKSQYRQFNKFSVYNQTKSSYSLSTIISNIEDCKNRVSISNGGEYIQTDELIERLKNDKT